MIAGLEAPTSGQILIEGRDVTTLGPADRNVSMMFQSYALFPHMDVLENVSYGLRMSGVAKSERAAARGRALRNVGLVDFDIACRANCPAASSSGWRWRARWCWSRPCCCSTSPCPTWMRGCDARCARRSARCSSACG